MDTERITSLQQQFEKECSEAAGAEDFERIRVKFLGRKGLLTQILRSLKDLSLEEKRRLGPIVNKLKHEWEIKLEIQKESQSRKRIGKQVAFDVTRPGKKVLFGHLHPITRALNEVIDIFSGMGFSVAEGPEIESEYYNFDALNIPSQHPARGMWDTFWLKSEAKSGKFLLRTHTSPVQARYMERHAPPLRIIVPGQTFRFEQVDATHGFQFQQIEGLLVDENVSIANLLAIVEVFFSRFFNKKVRARVRPSYFPFVEPGVEVDIFMNGKWIEMAGAGMVHPNVLKNVGYEPGRWTGFAFGFGFDRLVMMKYEIPDIRLLYGGDLRVINQF